MWLSACYSALKYIAYVYMAPHANITKRKIMPKERLYRLLANAMQSSICFWTEALEVPPRELFLSTLVS